MRWKEIRLFISSTFQDMHSERDEIHERVVPILQERLRERRCRLLPIDLRIGVSTLELDDERERELEVLRVCRKEIDRCRPLFLALVGDRYGFIPEPETIRRALGPDFPSAEGSSVTAVEIEHGLLTPPQGSEVRGYAYLREPLPYDEMDTATAARFCENFNPRGQASKAPQLLARLKERLRSSDLAEERIRSYRASWDPERKRVGGLEDFRQRLVEDLWRELDEMTRDAAPAATLDEDAEEDLRLDEFVEERGRFFFGREELLARLAEAATSPDPPGGGALVTGTAGTGKSAVFARLVQRLASEPAERPDRIVLAHATGAGPTAQSLPSLLERWSRRLAAALGVPAERSDEQSPQDHFRGLLLLAERQGREVILLLDGFDELDRPPARYLRWLPKSFGAGLRLVATAHPGRIAEDVARRLDLETLPLEAFDENAGRRVMEAVGEAWGRTFHPEIIAELLARRGEDGGRAAGNPLWLHIAASLLNLLGGEAFERARKLPGRPDEQLHGLLRQEIAALPATVPELYRLVFERAGRFEGEAYTRSFLLGLIFYRGGFRERDLLALVPRIAETLSPDPERPAWDALRQAGMRRALRGHLRSSGMEELWDFSHDQAYAAAWKHVALDEPTVQKLLPIFAAHLQALPGDDPLRLGRLPRTLLLSDDPAPFGRFYLALEEPGPALRAATRELADMLGTAEQHSGQSLAALHRWTRDERLGEDDRRRLALRILDELPATLQGSLGAEATLEIFENLEVWLREDYDTAFRDALEMTRQNPMTRHLQVIPGQRSLPDAPETHLPLLRLFARWGDLLRDRGEIEKRFRLSKRAARYAHELLGEDIGGELGASLAATLYNFGFTLYEGGQDREAHAWMLAALRLARRSRRHADPDDLASLASIAQGFADLLRRAGREIRARRATRYAVAVLRLALARNPGHWTVNSQLCGSLRWLAAAAQDDEDQAAASEFNGEGLQIAERMLQRYPTSVRWKRHLLLGLVRSAPDVERYAEAVRIAEELSEEFPDHIIIRHDAANSHFSLAQAFYLEGEHDRVIDHLVASLRFVAGDPDRSGVSGFVITFYNMADRLLDNDLRPTETLAATSFAPNGAAKMIQILTARQEVELAVKAFHHYCALRPADGVAAELFEAWTRAGYELAILALAEERRDLSQEVLDRLLELGAEYRVEPRLASWIVTAHQVACQIRWHPKVHEGTESFPDEATRQRRHFVLVEATLALTASWQARHAEALPHLAKIRAAVDQPPFDTLYFFWIETALHVAQGALVHRARDHHALDAARQLEAEIRRTIFLVQPEPVYAGSWARLALGVLGGLLDRHQESSEESLFEEAAMYYGELRERLDLPAANGEILDLWYPLAEKLSIGHGRRGETAGIREVWEELSRAVESHPAHRALRYTRAGATVCLGNSTRHVVEDEKTARALLERACQEFEAIDCPDEAMEVGLLLGIRPT